MVEGSLAQRSWPRLAVYVRAARGALLSNNRMRYDSDIEVLKRIYDRFNKRDIDGVLAVPKPT